MGTLYDEQCTGVPVYLQNDGDNRVNGTNAAIQAKPLGYEPEVLPGYYNLSAGKNASGAMMAIAAPAAQYDPPKGPTPTKFADEWEQWDDISRVTFMPVVGQEANIQHMGAMTQLTITKGPYFIPNPTTGQIVNNSMQKAQPIASSDDSILSLLMGA